MAATRLRARRLRALAYAKINLGLKIVGRRPDGFHELRTVFQTIALADRVEVALSPGSGVSLTLLPPRIPAGMTAPPDLFAAPSGAANLAVRAAELAREAFGLRGNIHIQLQKRIPMRAGLGGGSSNAATVLALLARAAGSRAQPARLLELAGRLGSDVAPFLIGGTVLGLGRGQEVYPLPPLPPWWCVLAMPAGRAGMDTPTAFRLWDERQAAVGARELTAAARSATINTFCSLVYQALPAFRFERNRSAIGRADGSSRAPKVQAGLENDFEQVVFPLAPDFPRLQRQLRRLHARWVSLSGSGAAQYGLFADRATAVQAARALSPGALVWVTRFTGRPRQAV